jgi:hypothetical protein
VLHCDSLELPSNRVIENPFSIYSRCVWTVEANFGHATGLDCDSPLLVVVWMMLVVC